MSDGEATGGEGSDGGQKKKIKLRIKNQSPAGSRAASPAPGRAGSVGGSRAGSPAAPQSMQSIFYYSIVLASCMVWKKSVGVPWSAIMGETTQSPCPKKSRWKKLVLHL
jgi:hypothetical protein